MLAAEQAWLLNEAAASAAGEARSVLREVERTAGQRHSRWVAEDSAWWLYMLGEPVAVTANLATPYREHCEGRWEPAAAGWRALDRPYEEAMALCGGDEAAQRHALEIFDRLGAVPAGARPRPPTRGGGSGARPRGPPPGGGAPAAGGGPGLAGGGREQWGNGGGSLHLAKARGAPRRGDQGPPRRGHPPRGGSRRARTRIAGRRSQKIGIKNPKDGDACPMRQMTP